MCTCRSERRPRGRIAAASTAVLALAILGAPWWAACESTPVQDQVADPGTSPQASPQESFDTGDILGVATMDDIAPILEQLNRSDALHTTAEQPPDCVDGFRRDTQQCVTQMRDVAMPCVEQIMQLFQDGAPDAAHEAAAQCRRQINEHAATCLTELQSDCAQCIEALMEQGAPQPDIEAVLGACRRAAEHILQARRAAAGAIDHAVDSGVAFACVRSVHEAAAGCVAYNGQKSGECVAEIETLLAGGQTEEAAAVGQDCTQNVVQHSVQCIGGIQQHCHDCLQALVRNCGNGRLIDAVQQACQESAAQVVGSAQTAVAAIGAALP